MKTTVEEIGELRRLKYFDDKNEYVDTPQINIFYSFIEEKGKDPQYIARICASIYNIILGNISEENEKEEFRNNFRVAFSKFINPESDEETETQKTTSKLADIMVNYTIREELLKLKNEYILSIEDIEWSKRRKEDENEIKKLEDAITSIREYINVLNEYIAKFNRVETSPLFQ